MTQNNPIDQGQVISDHNEKFFIEFERFLTKSGKSPRAIKRYLNQLGPYLTHYLGFREQTKAEEVSISQIPSYFDYFVMHKCMWSTKTAVQEGFPALRQFYKWMYERGTISAEKLEQILELALDKETKKEILEMVEDYESGQEGGMEDWF